MKHSSPAKSLAHDLGLEESMVRRWVRFYELYGLAWLQHKSNRENNVEFKLKVLEEMDSGGFNKS